MISQLVAITKIAAKGRETEVKLNMQRKWECVTVQIQQGTLGLAASGSLCRMHGYTQTYCHASLCESVNQSFCDHSKQPMLCFSQHGWEQWSVKRPFTNSFNIQPPLPPFSHLCGLRSASVSVCSLHSTQSILHHSQSQTVSCPWRRTLIW